MSDQGQEITGHRLRSGNASDPYWRAAGRGYGAGYAWPPMPRMPANDNEPSLRVFVSTLVKRHMNWLVPTLALAALSFTLLGLNG